jgi:hypothetical protein
MSSARTCPAWRASTAAPAPGAASLDWAARVARGPAHTPSRLSAQHGLSALINGRNPTRHPLLQMRQKSLQIWRVSLRVWQSMFAVAIGSEVGRDIHTNEQEQLLLPKQQYRDRQSGVERQSALARRLLLGVLSSIPTVLGYLGRQIGPAQERDFDIFLRDP